MFAKVNLEFKAKDADRAVRRRDLIIVVDVLRCSSSILNAFANGAKAVIPVEALREAYKIRREHPDYLLAGERGGLKPQGFDFGNSPAEFTDGKVNGKTLVFTTTSGTQALTRSKAAEWVMVGGFLNTGSVAKKALKIAERAAVNVSLVLSGAKGHFSLEDFVCAGAIVDRFPEEKVELSDASYASVLTFRCVKNNLLDNILKGEHARHLVSLGFERDIEFSCQMDLLPIVPIYRDGVIRLLK